MRKMFCLFFLKQGLLKETLHKKLKLWAWYCIQRSY